MILCSCRTCWMKMTWRWQLMHLKNLKLWCLVQTGKARKGAVTTGRFLVCLWGMGIGSWYCLFTLFIGAISLQICNVCLLGWRKRGRVEVVAGTGNEGTDLALGLVLGLEIRTGENPDTDQGAGVRVPVGTVRIERSTSRRAMRDGEIST